MVQWRKKGGGYESRCGRFAIERLIRRSGVEWRLVDRAVPVEPGVSGAVRTLRQAKDAAEWRLANRPVSGQEAGDEVQQGVTTRLRPGLYQYTLAGRTFHLEEVGLSEGYQRRQWNVSEVVDGRSGAPFDAAETLADAKFWARTAAQQEAAR